MPPINVKDVVLKLKGCSDPEIGINIVDLGLIHNIRIDEKRIT
jgi:Domain of unknown function DUF59.